MRRFGNFGIVTICLLLHLVLPATKVNACPILQLYVEGATYNSITESWTLDAYPSNSGEVNFRLWVIGNPNPRGRLYDVRLSVAYPAWLRSGSSDLQFSFVPSTTGGLGGFYDPSTPSVPLGPNFGLEGTSPTIVDSSTLPWHGVYGPGVVWQEFRLGDFYLKDSPLGDFYQVFPQPTNKWGQINVYDVSVRHMAGISLVGTTLHFDAYGYVKRGKRNFPVFAPFSHDADVHVVPNPPTLALLCSLLVSGGGWLAFRRVSFRLKSLRRATETT